MSRIIERFFVVLLLLVSLAACGGGGGGSSSSSSAPGSGDTSSQSLNQLPVAYAGDDIVVDAGTLVVLDGSASFDLDGDSLSYQWRQVQGTPVVLVSESISMPSFIAPEQHAVLSYELIVSDAQGNSSSDRVNVVVIEGDNTVPIAHAGDNRTVNVMSTVALNAFQSSDVDGDNLSYSWSQLSGTPVVLSSASSPNPSFSAPGLADTLHFSLIVSDGKSLSEPSEVIISVVAPIINLPPIADAGEDLQVNPTARVRLSGEQSYDPNGDELTYQWTQVGGGRVPLSYSLSAYPEFTAPISGGVFSFGLVVRDNRGLVSTEDIVTVTVGSSNSVPVANAGGDQDVLAGQLVQLDGRASSDADGEALSYFWRQVSGSTQISLSNAASSSPTFIAPGESGTYTFDLIVDDGQISSLPDAVVISVAANNTPPVANAGGDQRVDAGALVVLNATASFDPDGDQITYLWSSAGAAGVTLSSASDPTPTFNAPAEATTLYFDLVVSDGEFDSNPSRVTISVDGENRPPVSDAGESQSVTGLSTVQLDGVSSQDPDGDSLAFSWQQISGANVVLDDPSSNQPTFIAPNLADTLVFSLVVSDGDLSSSSDTVSISITPVNLSPVASAGLDQSADEGSLVTLNGSLSSDPEGESLTYRWRQVSGPVSLSISNALQASANFVAPSLVGDYVLGLVVNDGLNDSAEDTVVVSVAGVNERPLAVAGIDQLVEAGALVLLDGSASTDPDGDGLTYLWTQTSGTSVELSSNAFATPSFSAPNEASVLTFTLTVNDGEYYSPPDEIQITVASANTAPVANAGIDQVAFANSLVTLDGQLSSDAEGDALTYAWTIVSGEGIQLNDSTSATPQFSAPESEGIFEFSLVVNDGQLDSATDSVIVNVQPINQPPVADAGSNVDVLGHAAVVLDGVASSDPDGDSLTYTWVQVAGETVAISSEGSSASFLAPNIDGVLRFSLTVNDGELDSPESLVEVAVTAYNEAPIANAGADQSVTGGDLVTLDGTLSVDPEGEALSYAWLQLAGPEVVALNDVNLASPTFSAPPLGGEFVFSLIVNDGELDSLEARVTIVAQEINVAPTADAGADQSVNGLETVLLNAEGSEDPNGDEITYLWSQVSGAPVTLSGMDVANPSFDAPNIDDVLEFSLVVNDGVLDSTADTVLIVLNLINELPVANAGANQEVTGDDVVFLIGGDSYDPEGEPVTYQWAQTSGDAVVLDLSNPASPSFIAPSQGGLYTFSLIVNDGEQDSIADYVSVNVLPANNPPVANAGVDRFVSTGSVVTLQGNRSFDPDGDELTYTWQQLSGPQIVLSSLSAAAPSFTAAEDGRIELSLVANDGELDSLPDSIVITVGVIPLTNTMINDTGILWGGEVPSGNNETCIGEAIESQDCYQGRDLTHNDDTDGKAGFSYTKISDEGVELNSAEADWNCVLDNVTGLMWEVKQGGNDIVGDEGLHDADDRFNWYDPDPSTNGSTVGYENDDGAICADYDELDSNSFCNSHAYVERVNAQGYCGYSDWRMPTRKELLSLVNYGQDSRMLEDNYFPQGGVNVWSSTPFALGSTSAWAVSFSGGNSYGLGKSNAQRIRLVRHAP